MTRSDRGIRNYAKLFRGFTAEEKQEIFLFCDIYAQSKDLRNFLNAPHLSIETKAQLIQKVFGKSFKTETIKFLQFLLHRERLKDLPEIVISYEALNGKKTASLISSEPLAEGIVKQIQTQLNAATGSQYDLNPIQDKRLIGGFLVKADNRIFDGSMKNSLLLLKRQLGKAACS